MTYHVKAGKIVPAIGMARAVPMENAFVKGAGLGLPAILSVRALTKIRSTGRVATTGIVKDGLCTQSYNCT